jgi:hypothetical protein
MMGDQDEAAVLAQLRQHPPGRVLYFNFGEKELLETWPASDPYRLRFAGFGSVSGLEQSSGGVIDTPKRTFDVLEPNVLEQKQVLR